VTFISDCLCTTVMTKWAGYPVLPNHDGKTINVTDNTILVTVSKYVTGNLSWITRFLVVDKCETILVMPSILLGITILKL